LVPAIVLGKGRNALAVCRGLGRRGVPVTLANSDPADPARASRYCVAVTTPNPTDEPEAYAELILDLASRGSVAPAVIPTGDQEVTLVSERRNQLRPTLRFVMAELETMRALVRKDSFAALAARAGLAAPDTWAVHDRAGLETAARAVRFPCVVKPAYSPAWRRVRFGPPLPPDQRGKMKRLVVGSVEDLRAAFEQAAPVDPTMVVQERVEGGDDALHDVYVHLGARGNAAATFVIRKRRTWPIDGNGTGSCVESVKAPELADVAVAFLRRIRYRGTAAVCFKQSATDGRFLAIEVNARLALHHGLAAREGVDLAWLAYLDALDEPLPVATPTSVGTRWISGWEDRRATRAYRARATLGDGEWRASVRGPRVGAFFARDDAAPALRHAAAQLPWLARAASGFHAASRIAKRGLGAGLYWSGALRFLRRRDSGGPIVLRYHSVGGESWLLPDLVVSARHFAQQVRHLRRAYRVVSLEDALASIERGVPAPPRTVAITFDDGYRDNQAIAAPILHREGCPATVFAVVDSIESGAPPWPQRLYLTIQQSRTTHASVPLPPPDGEAPRRFDLSTPAGRGIAYRVLRRVVASLGPKERETFLVKLAEMLGVERAACLREEGMLDWQAARELGALGIRVASHSMTHTRLKGLPDDELTWELVEARRRLEAGLGREVTLLAYPFGKARDVGERTQRAARDAGYRAAFMAMPGRDGPGADPFALRRIKVRDEPGWRFALRLAALERSSPLLTWILK
jgi:predicted ATP-grasp superfamily ATP-dependent carboligase/peptidoglycan/xylan/chitin deacetylase (PgdA/CDA1 family)